MKRFIQEYFEQIFVLVLLLVTATINYYIPQKLAFLNLYFLPIIIGAYSMGRRTAVLGALFCVILVSGYAYLSPESFGVGTGDASWSLATHIVIWGGFLVLAGAVVGGLAELLGDRIEAMQDLNDELAANESALTAANAALKDYSENLEAKVSERTVELERSHKAIETMKQKVENALYSTMDPTVVNLMIEGQLRNEKRNVSLLFSDLVNFTTYSEKHPPEVVISELNRYLRDVEPIIHAYRGHIDKYMGDGIMCEFGAPVNYATYRTMAVLAGLKLQKKLGALNYPWQMRVGIASGPVVTGLIGFKRQTFTAIGDVVNLAARLERACTPGGVLIDQETYAGVGDFVVAEKKRQFGPAHGDADAHKEYDLAALEEQLVQEPENAELHYRIGLLYLGLLEPVDALVHIEKALKLDPSSTAFKIAYAEAGMQLREQEKISVKGRRQRVTAYEVTGLRDPLLDRRKIPANFYTRYGKVGELIKIPNDLILPIEVMDDSVGHSRVVAVLSYVIASALGVAETEKLAILQAAFLAEIGKEIVPHHILNRGDSATPAEYAIIRQHPIEGGKILRKLGYENAAMIGIVTHVHERFNGSGYPQGLKGEAIPLGARIVGVADAYDSLTSRRSYREPWAREAALQEIRRETEGGQFDPKVVNILFKLLSAPAGPA